MLFGGGAFDGGSPQSLDGCGVELVCGIGLIVLEAGGELVGVLEDVVDAEMAMSPRDGARRARLTGNRPWQVRARRRDVRRRKPPDRTGEEGASG